MTILNEKCILGGMTKYYRKILEENGFVFIELDTYLDIHYLSPSIDQILKKETDLRKNNFFDFIENNFLHPPIQKYVLDTLKDQDIHKSCTEEFYGLERIQLDWTFTRVSIEHGEGILILIQKTLQPISDYWHSILTSFIDQCECYVFLKNTNSQFIGGNKKFIDICQLKNEQQLYNKTDYDMHWSRAESDSYVYEDKKFITHKKPLTLIRGTHLRKIIVSSKYPLYNHHSDVVGLIGFYIYPYKNADLSFLRFIDQKWKNHNENYIFKNHECTYENLIIRLTNREVQCAELLIKGLSIKRIASTLDLSHRTIEKHVEHLKNKFICSSKEQLLRKIIKSNIIELIS
jgi:DNA-binding CsgD family transcriptional regulator